MNRTVFFILCCAVFGLAPARGEDAGDSSGDAFYRKAPRPLLEVWLRFHEAGLCQGVEASFEFSDSGMKVRSVVEDEKSFQKFQEMLAPLQNSFRIEQETVRPDLEEKEEDEEGEKSRDDNDPPASLWENNELRYNLGDPLAALQRDGVAFVDARDSAISDWVLKQRLYLYAVQTIDLNRKMERYASLLNPLARMARDAAVAPDLQSRANALCLAHAVELGKVLSKLNANLGQAIPKPEKKRKPRRFADDSKSALTASKHIADAAGDVARQVRRFLHPEQFTVGLDDLRAPGILDCLENLTAMTLDFQKEIGKSVKKKK